MNNINELETVFVALQGLAGKLGREDMVIPIQRLREKNLRREWQLVVIGETSTGKSCLINSLVDENILPEQSAPTTGQIVVVHTQSGQDKPVYSGVSLAGSKADLSRSEFEKATSGDHSWISLRAELPQRTILPRGVVVVDTPGFNSCVEKHSEVLLEYLPQADAVLFMTNHRRGFTEQDVAFLDLAIKNIGKQNLDMVFYAANFCPSIKTDARIMTMQKQIAKHVGKEITLHLISSGKNQPRRLSADTLWQDLTANVEKMDLPKTVSRNLLRLSEGITSILAGSLEIFEQAASAEKSDLDRLEKQLVQLKLDQKESTATIEAYHGRLTSVVHEAVCEGVAKISIKAGHEIESSSRFTDASGCGAYLRGHFIQNEVEIIVMEVGRQIEDLFKELAENLEQLAGRADIPESQKVRVGEAGPGSALKTMRDQAIKYGSARVAAGYLASLGGNLGLLNLVRRSVRQIGDLIGQTYTLDFYTVVIPGILRKIGLRAPIAIEGFAYIVVESAAKVYHFATWKNSLKAVVDRALGVTITDEPWLDQLKNEIPYFQDKSEPVVTKLQRAFHEAINEGIAETNGLVQTDFCARINIRSEALKIRSEKPDAARAMLREMRADLERIAEKLNKISE